MVVLWGGLFLVSELPLYVAAVVFLINVYFWPLWAWLRGSRHVIDFEEGIHMAAVLVHVATGGLVGLALKSLM
ncbi:hypothetical protein T484DRAFT_1927473 [Baffinella frigidus]|nr:hypothetical protein T484DRAFT_1927473 [Cryptophyta sp. CCMP2293]